MRPEMKRKSWAPKKNYKPAASLPRSTRQLSRVQAGDAGWSWLFAMKGPGPIGNDAMRDKLEHLREEVNVVSRGRDNSGQNR